MVRRIGLLALLLLPACCTDGDCEGGLLDILVGGAIDILLDDGAEDAPSPAPDPPSFNDPIYLDDVLLAVDLETGDRFLLARAVAVDPRACAYDPDEDRLLVWDGASGEVVAIALATGHRAVIARPPLASVRALAPAPPYGAVAAAGAGLVRIDLVTGEATPLDGPGPALVEPCALARDAQGRLFVADAQAGTILAVDDDGARTLVTGAGRGDGPRPGRPAGLAFDDGTAMLLLLDETSELFVIDPGSGDRTALPRGGGFAQVYGDPAGLAASPGGALAAHLYPASEALTRIDVQDGERTRLSGLNVGSGPLLRRPAGVAYDPARREALLLGRR